MSVCMIDLFYTNCRFQFHLTCYKFFYVYYESAKIDECIIQNFYFMQLIYLAIIFNTSQ